MKRTLYVLCIIGIASAVGWFVYSRLNLSAVTYDKTGGVQEVACSMEAKQCPDGSYVGRSGPKCEFAPCPTIENSVPVPQPPAPLP